MSEIRKAEELVIAYARQTTIIRESKAAIKEKMQEVGEDEFFCESPIHRYPGSPEESCLRRHINKELGLDAMCDTCQTLWPNVSARYEAKKERSKTMVRINALGKRLIAASERDVCAKGQR